MPPRSMTRESYRMRLTRDGNAGFVLHVGPEGDERQVGFKDDKILVARTIMLSRLRSRRISRLSLNIYMVE